MRIIDWSSDVGSSDLHRPEDLLLRNAHAVANIVEHRRLEVAATGFGHHPLAAQRQRRALALTLLDITQYPLQMALIDHRPHRRIGIERVPRLQLDRKSTRLNSSH